jgi:hypothetical protein
MPRYIPPSIEKSGGIVAFLNLPNQIAKHQGFSGDNFLSVMAGTGSKRLKILTTREQIGILPTTNKLINYSTVAEWVRRWEKEQ